jgi:hypothetical protein
VQRLKALIIEERSEESASSFDTIFPASTTIHTASGLGSPLILSISISTAVPHQEAASKTGIPRS